VIGNYHLDFTTSKVATSFCNTLGGEYFTVDNQIFGEFIQTNMACFDEEKTSLESAFDLNGATFDRVDAQLIITTPAGHIFIYALLSSPTSSGTNQLLTTGEVTTLTKEDIDATDAQDPEQLREVLKENFNPKPYF
jgi:hypothetical protein